MNIQKNQKSILKILIVINAVTLIFSLFTLNNVIFIVDIALSLLLSVTLFIITKYAMLIQTMAMGKSLMGGLTNKLGAING